nr:hypothetical protein [Tanacetum cinerariifolium]
MKNSNGVNVRCEGMKEFVECIEDLEMEDINMCGMFYTWIQRIRNPKLENLKKLDRVMGNSKFISYSPLALPTMPYLSSDHCSVILDMLDVAMFRPKSFRFMNFLADKSKFKEVVKIIGILMLKVKFLKVELSRVQECLDKDPSCSILEEEEMVYYQAYKDAMINEEKLFVSHLSNFLGTYDDVLHIEDPNSLFVKKLDVKKSVELIKDVFDLEIKEALFNIKDNKASGPNGYSSKFFLIYLESGRAG